MTRSWLTLVEDEEVLWRGHPSRYAHLAGYGLGLGVAVVGIALAIGGVRAGVMIGPVTGSIVGLALAVAGAGIAGLEHLRRASTHYVLTNKHVYKKRGILSRDVDPIRLDRIADFEYSQSAVDRLLGIGEVRIMTAGTGGKDVVLEDVPSVQTVAERISRELDRTSGRAIRDRS